MGHCAALNNPNTVWNFCPNFGADVFFIILFACTTIAHAVQMFYYRKAYSWVIVCSGCLQTALYILRALSIKNPENETYYTTWFVMMMVAPLWTNAYAYMVMARMVYNYTISATICKIKAWRFGLIFVVLDIVAFLIQAAGAIAASGSGKTTNQIMSGLHIYMGGVGFQELCILLFLIVAVQLHRRILAEVSDERIRTAKTLMYVEYAVVTLISVRIIFRIIEYSQGFASGIPTEEAYQYVLDSTLMFTASVLFNIFHPGRLMHGKESNLPSRKERKTAKKNGETVYGRVASDDMTLLAQKQADHSRSVSPGVDVAEAVLMQKIPGAGGWVSPDYSRRGSDEAV